MTTFQRLMAVYWCLLPFELVFTWLDASRQRQAPATDRRRTAARRQLALVPAVAVQYVVAFAVGLTLVARLRRLDGSQQVLGAACLVVLLLVAWADSRRIGEAWRESELRRHPRPGSVVVLEVEVGVEGGVVGRGLDRRRHRVVVGEERAVLAAPHALAEDRPARHALEQRR